MDNLYIFIDVSGNYDFSPKGTKYIVITSLICDDVSPGILELHTLKHDIISQGVNIEYFHASEDRQAVRDSVFDVISHLGRNRIDSLIVEKRKTAPSLRPLNRFYPKMVEYLLQYPLNPQGIDINSFKKVFIFVDRESSRTTQKRGFNEGFKNITGSSYTGRAIYNLYAFIYFSPLFADSRLLQLGNICEI
jgi:hypothetical protein